ncbi:hypothetical protein [Rhodococcus globerulus]|uniref:Uncharacterized protein n=1 Tax=Rhodococcus globerulus TaxID=33008 RepID=A0ABU4C5Z4_RHOGO|nr:hypothetical protein [Rhodococcus globerulus]MDV6271788.1 hypothetical protein [Rhodococcus globerulus]
MAAQTKTVLTSSLWTRLAAADWRIPSFYWCATAVASTVHAVD